MAHALLATHLNGGRLDIDHGYPLRLIAPDRAGVLNTKWLHVGGDRCSMRDAGVADRLRGRACCSACSASSGCSPQIAG